MTRDELVALTKRVSFFGLFEPWGITISVEDSGRHLTLAGFLIVLSYRRPDVEGGAADRGVTAFEVTRDHDEAMVLNLLLRQFRYLVEHEAEESFLVDGKRHSNPHARDRT